LNALKDRNQCPFVATIFGNNIVERHENAIVTFFDVSARAGGVSPPVMYEYLAQDVWSA
jgi:hypothetical protein